MRVLFQWLISLILLPGVAFANCSGTDLRPTLALDQRSEIDTRLAGQPYTKGNHWQAVKNGQTLHIIGTIHLDDPRLDAVSQRLKAIVDNADLLLVEATGIEEKQLQAAVATRPDVMFITSGPSLIDQMDPEEWARLGAAAEARGIPPFMAAKFQPWYLSLILAMPPCVLAQMGSGLNGLDRRMLDLAEAADVPARALEPWDTLFTIFGAEPMDEQIEMLKISTFSVQQAEDGVATLVNQYFEQDHGAVMDTSRVTTRGAVDMETDAFDAAFDDMLDALLVERNLQWMDVIDGRQDKNIVIAVGAGHLSGDQGVLNLLARRGYKMSRQTF